VVEKSVRPARRRLPACQKRLIRPSIANRMRNRGLIDCQDRPAGAAER